MPEVDCETETEQDRINVAAIGDSLAKYFIPENEKSYRYNSVDYVLREPTFDVQCVDVAARRIPSKSIYVDSLRNQ